MKLIVITVIITLSVLPVLASEKPGRPVFEKTGFLLTEIEELNIDYALVWTDSMASLFVDPVDAVILHVRSDGIPKDIFIISDAAQDRLAFFQCSSGESKERAIEKMQVYRGEDVHGLDAPSGMATSAVGREYNPEEDVIYLADMYNDRILELVYLPNEKGGEMYCNRILAEGYVEYPIDLDIANFGNLRAPDPALMVVDLGHEENEGCLRKISLEGTLEGVWDEFPIPEYHEMTRNLDRPVAIACIPDTIEGSEAIFISEEAYNSVFRFAYTGEGDPEMTWEELLELPGSYCKPGGIAIDDCGRIYVTNEASGRIETFGPHFEAVLGKFGEPGEGPEQFMMPSNIIIDTYYGYCEALILEWYGRQSGFQTYLIGNEAYSSKINRGFAPMNLVKPQTKSDSQTPRFFALHDAYPNPFNSACQISFDIPQRTHVALEVFNVLGQRVVTLIDEAKDPGSYSIKFSGENLSSGVYIYLLRTGEFRGANPMVLIK